MGIGQIISDTFGMVKERFGQLLALWAIYFGITIALFFVLAIGIGAAGVAGIATMAGSDPLAVGGGMLLLVVLFYIGYLLVAMAQYASLILMASPIHRPTVGDALGAGWRAAPALLLLMVVLVVGYVAAAMALGLVGTAFSAVGDWARTLFALLLLPVLAWLGCRLSPLFAVVAVDGVRNPFTAIARAWDLTQGHALTIFLAFVVFMLILLLVCGVALLPSIGLLRSMSDPAAVAAAEPAWGGLLLLFLGMLVAGVLFNLCYCAFLAAIHGRLTSASGEGVVEAFA